MSSSSSRAPNFTISGSRSSFETDVMVFSLFLYTLVESIFDNCRLKLLFPLLHGS